MKLEASDIALVRLGEQIDRSVKRIKTQFSKEDSPKQNSNSAHNNSVETKVSLRLDSEASFFIQKEISNASADYTQAKYANQSYNTVETINDEPKILIDFLHPNNQKYDFKI